MSEQECPITGDIFDPTEDHYWRVEDESGAGKAFAGRVGIDVLEDYIADKYPSGAYYAELHNEDASPVDHSVTERMFSVTNETAGDVTLSIGVDAEGASDEQLQMYEEMATMFEESFELFVQKNLDYDSSFLSAGEVDQILDNGDGPFDSAIDANLYKVFTRLQDKDQRFYSQAFCGNEDRVGEDAIETATDAAVYWFMMAWMLKYGQDDE